MTVIMAILVVYCFFQIIATVLGFVQWIESSYMNWTPALFPAEWYRKYNLNWFGAILGSIIGFILLPIIYLGRILAWLCRVGRK